MSSTAFSRMTPSSKIREHTTDTGGFTEPLWGFCLPLGIDFMPRLKDLADQTLYRVDRGADYGPLDPLLRNVIDIAIIIEQWDQLVRIAASLKDRLTPAHVVLQRVINASPADRVAKALDRFGPSGQIRPHPALHPRRAAAAGNPAPAQPRRIPPHPRQVAVLRQPRRLPHRRLRGDHEQGELPQPHVERCPRLEHRPHQPFVSELRAAGNLIPDEDLARVSPLAHAHTIPSGTYFQSPRRRADIAPEPVTA